MTRLEWGARSPFYDLGVDQGVLYLADSAVPWNGLVSVNEQAVGEIDVDHYFDGNRFHIASSSDDYKATVSAYTYPDAFSEYNGYSERELYRRFGFSYRTQHGPNYKIHLVYSALVKDDSRSWQTIAAAPDPSLFNWDISAESVPIPGARPASRLTMEASMDSGILAPLEDILYGTEITDPRLPDPSELIELYETATTMRITYNGDGSYTASGPDSVVKSLGEGRFEIDAPTVFFLQSGKFSVNSF